MKTKLIILALVLGGCTSTKYTRDEYIQQYTDNYIQYVDTEDHQDLMEANRAWRAFLKTDER
jgi:PBP1b-binding outer membrane lipoprotein LpoB